LGIAVNRCPEKKPVKWKINYKKNRMFPILKLVGDLK